METAREMYMVSLRVKCSNLVWENRSIVPSFTLRISSWAVWSILAFKFVDKLCCTHLSLFSSCLFISDSNIFSSVEFVDIRYEG
jgi:uncharacterized protein with WD repeat